MSEIINKVANSALTTINLENYLPKNLLAFDLKPFLFMELILKEKDYRQALKDHDWSMYADKPVAIFCSADAIVPQWAYMLATVYLKEVTDAIYFGTPEQCSLQILLENIKKTDVLPYQDQRLVIKGCGEVEVPTEAYVAITNLLLPIAKSIMYGEPCSTVPIYKQKK